MKRYVRTQKSVETLDAFFGASAEELRVLCLFLSSEQPLSAEDVLTLCRLESLGEAKDALAFWRGAGVIKMASGKSADKKEQVIPTETEKSAQDDAKTDKAPVYSADELPVYSGEHLSSLIEKDNLASFIEACQQIYGKVLSTTDINILVAIREELHFDCEYICLLLAFYAGRKEKDDKPPKPMKYIERTAFSLFNRGILTVAQLEPHLERLQRMQTREGHLRKLFGIGERALSTKEEEAFLRWCEEYGYDDAVIGVAYDITVGATGKAAVNYADKIITHWNTEGCKNLSDVQALLAREKAALPAKKIAKTEKDAEKESMRSFEVDDFFARALDRSYGDASKK